MERLVTEEAAKHGVELNLFSCHSSSFDMLSTPYLTVIDRIEQINAVKMMCMHCDKLAVGGCYKSHRIISL